MLIEDVIIYTSIGVATIVVIWLLRKSKGTTKKTSFEKAERNWTLTPPTSSLCVSKMKNSNSSSSLKGVQKKSLIIEKPTPKAKAANWKDAGSFEDDVSQINLDTIMTKKFKKEASTHNAFEKRNSIQKNEMRDSNGDSDIKSYRQDYKVKVLLVDDSAVILKKTGDMLKANSYEVVTKKDGAEAIEWLEANISLPEIVITDMEMPKMNGEELVEKMRADERFAEIPVLVISAHAERHIRLMEKQMIQGFLKKPFTESDLISQLEFFLSE